MARLLVALLSLSAPAQATDWCSKAAGNWYYGDDPPEIVDSRGFFPCKITGQRIECERSIRGTIEYRASDDTIILKDDDWNGPHYLKRCWYEPRPDNGNERVSPKSAPWYIGPIEP